MKLFDQYKGLRKELYILFFGRIVTNLGGMIWPMLTLILNQKLSMSAEEVANWLLAFSILGLPFNLFGGKLADKVNKKSLIVICDLLSVICFIVCGLLPLSKGSILIFGVASLLQSVEYPAYDALVADFSTPKDRERAYSLNYLGANFGLILSPTLGGLLFKNYLNLAFIINGIAILSSTILIFFLIKNVEKEYDEDDINEYENEYESSTLSFLKQSKTLLLYLVSGLLYNTIYNQWNYLLPIQLGVEYGENGSLMYGTLTSVNCITVVIMTAIITTALVKVKEIDKCFIAQILEVVGLFMSVFFIKTTVLVYVGIIIFTLGEIIDTIAHSSFTSKRVPANHRGRYASIVNVVATLFTSLSSKAIGAIFDKAGSGSAWNVVYMIGIVNMILLIVVKKFDKKEYPKLYE